MEAARESEHGAGHQGAKEGAGRALAQAFCLVTGLVLIAVGVLGFFFGGGDFTSGSGVSGAPFIVFEVNGWHNIVRLASGAFLLLMAEARDGDHRRARVRRNLRGRQRVGIRRR